MHGDEKPTMEFFGVSRDTINRVHRERKRRADIQARFSARQREASREADEPMGGALSLVFAAFLAMVIGPMLGGCISLPFMFITQSADPAKVLMIATGAVVFVVAFVKSAYPRRRNVKQATGAEQQPDLVVGALSTDDEIASVDRYEEAVRWWEFSTWKRWSALNGTEFEHDLAEVLKRAGWKVRVTPASGDGGVDIVGETATRRRVAIQCKWWTGKCGVKTIRELAGVLGAGGEKTVGIVVCKGGFSRDAREFAQQRKIILWGEHEVKALLDHPESCRDATSPVL